MASQNRLAYLGGAYEQVRDRLNSIDSRFAEIMLELRETSTRTDGRFIKMDDRFDKMDERFDKMDERFDKMNERFNTMNIDLRRDMHAIFVKTVSVLGALMTVLVGIGAFLARHG